MDTTDPPVAKRQRTETADEPRPIPERDTHWYDDGNIVLSVNSVIFKDMFSLPQPAVIEDEMVDGCPVVYLSDSVADLRYVLEAFYNGRYVKVGLDTKKNRVSCTDWV
jgi:hypothetical protein